MTYFPHNCFAGGRSSWRRWLWADRSVTLDSRPKRWWLNHSQRTRATRQTKPSFLWDTTHREGDAAEILAMCTWVTALRLLRMFEIQAGEQGKPVDKWTEGTDDVWHCKPDDNKRKQLRRVSAKCSRVRLKEGRSTYTFFHHFRSMKMKVLSWSHPQPHRVMMASNQRRHFPVKSKNKFLHLCRNRKQELQFSDFLWLILHQMQPFTNTKAVWLSAVQL